MGIVAWILLSAIIGIALAILIGLAWGYMTEDAEQAGAGIVLGSILFPFMVAPMLSGLFGVNPNYGNGMKDGYLVAVTEQGFIFTTTESELQVGTGQQVSVQGHFDFSATAPDIVAELHADLGKHVQIHYHRFYKRPWAAGDTNFIADQVTVLP